MAAADEVPMIVVLGPFRGGTSCVAGVLHHLGVHMGRRFHRIGGARPETYEELALQRLCREVMGEPGTTRDTARGDTTARLAAWAAVQRAEAAAAGRPPGAKHPWLCAMIPQMKAAFGPLVAVSVERPLERATASLAQLGWWGQTPERYGAIQRRLVAQRDRALAALPHVVVGYEALVAEPRSGVERLAAALGLAPNAAAIDEAVRSVSRPQGA